MTLQQMQDSVQGINRLSSTISDETILAQVQPWFQAISKNLQCKNPSAELIDLMEVQYDYRQKACDTVLILGSGPSLVDPVALEKVKKIAARPNVFVIAGVTNLAWLLFNNINPDVVLVSDASPDIYRWYNRTVELFGRHQWFLVLPVFQPVSKWPEYQRYFYLPTLFEGVPGKEPERFSVLFNAMLTSLFGGIVRTFFHQNGSVANTAVIFAIHLQAERKIPISKILLAGVDLAVIEEPVPFSDEIQIRGRAPKVDINDSGFKVDYSTIRAFLPEYRELFEYSKIDEHSRLLCTPPWVLYKNAMYGMLPAFDGSIHNVTPKQLTLLHELPSEDEPYNIQEIVGSWLNRWPEISAKIDATYAEQEKKRLTQEAMRAETEGETNADR